MREGKFQERNYIKNIYLRAKELYSAKKYDIFVKESAKYLEIAPKDINMRFMRAKALRLLNRFEESIKELKFVLNLECDSYALAELYYIYYYLNMYNEAIELLPVIYKTKCINSYSVSISEMIMKKQLGMDIRAKKGDKCAYIRSQIFSYSTSSALDHIKSHLDETQDSSSSFNKDINLEYLFEVVRKNIKNSKKVNKEEILEIHYFGISNVGYYNDDICNFIKVVVIPNTDNIISMYPILNTDYSYKSDCPLNLDCDYEKLFNKPKSNVKNLSRIDKFNNKFKRV